MLQHPDQDQLFMTAALSEAQQAARHGEVPIGCVVTHNNRIIGRGHNRCEALQDPTAHAEIIAITAASEALGSWRLENCTLYATIEPCPMCLGACLNARVPRVVYGAPEPKAGACGSVVDLSQLPAFNHRLSVTGGVLKDQSADLMRSFFRQLRQR